MGRCVGGGESGRRISGRGMDGPGVAAADGAQFRPFFLSRGPHLAVEGAQKAVEGAGGMQGPTCGRRQGCGGVSGKVVVGCGQLARSAVISVLFSFSFFFPLLYSKCTKTGSTLK